MYVCNDNHICAFPIVRADNDDVDCYCNGSDCDWLYVDVLFEKVYMLEKSRSNK